MRSIFSSITCFKIIPRENNELKKMRSIFLRKNKDEGKMYYSISKTVWRKYLSLKCPGLILIFITKF